MRTRKITHCTMCPLSDHGELWFGWCNAYATPRKIPDKSIERTERPAWCPLPITLVGAKALSKEGT